jgi:hypothetical protein
VPGVLQSTDRSPGAGGHVEQVNVKYRDSDYSTIENPDLRESSQGIT